MTSNKLQLLSTNQVVNFLRSEVVNLDRSQLVNLNRPRVVNFIGFCTNTTVFDDNTMILGDNNTFVGIGLSNAGVGLGPQKSLEINSDPASIIFSGINQSGLRFRQLTSASPSLGHFVKFLTVDINGDVVLGENSNNEKITALENKVNELILKINEMEKLFALK